LGERETKHQKRKRAILVNEKTKLALGRESIPVVWIREKKKVPYLGNFTEREGKGEGGRVGEPGGG